MENENEKGNETTGLVYEVGYLLVPSIPEEGLGGEVSKLKDSLINLGASIISDDYPKMMELAYEMTRSVDNKNQKFSYGYFGWVKFSIDVEEIMKVKKELDKNEKIIRHLLIKTIRENTMSQRRTYNRSEGFRRKVAPKIEESLPINEETIDKEIEALMVE